jgi:hypothetical protein
MDYMLKRWTVFTRFLDDGRICLSNNAAERGVRGIALGRNYVHHVIMRSSSREAPRFPWQGWAKAGAHTVLLCT